MNKQLKRALTRFERRIIELNDAQATRASYECKMEEWRYQLARKNLIRKIEEQNESRAKKTVRSK